MRNDPNSVVTTASSSSGVWAGADPDNQASPTTNSTGREILLRCGLGTILFECGFENVSNLESVAGFNVTAVHHENGLSVLKQGD